MYENNKSLEFLRKITIVLFVADWVANIVLFSSTGFINIFVIITWIIGLLGLLGYIKSVEKVEGNVTTYSISIPMVPVFLLRIVQFLVCRFTALGKDWFSVKSFLILIGCDAVLLMFSIMQNSSYYYESVFEEDESNVHLTTDVIDLSADEEESIY